MGQHTSHQLESKEMNEANNNICSVNEQPKCHIHKLKRILKKVRCSQKRKRKKVRKEIGLVPAAVYPSEKFLSQSLLQETNGKAKLQGKSSILRPALSKFALFVKLSKESIPEEKKLTKRFVFHKPRILQSKDVNDIVNNNDVPESSFSISPQLDGNNMTQAAPLPTPISSIEAANTTSKFLEHCDSSMGDTNNLTTLLVKRILSQKSTLVDKENSSEEVYAKNLKRFEKLVAISLPSSSSGEDTDQSHEESYDGTVIKRRTRIAKRRIIPTSKNQVSLDSCFVEWVKSRAIQSSRSSQLPRGQKVENWSAIVKLNTVKVTDKRRPQTDINNNPLLKSEVNVLHLASKTKNLNWRNSIIVNKVSVKSSSDSSSSSSSPGTPTAAPVLTPTTARSGREVKDEDKDGDNVSEKSQKTASSEVRSRGRGGSNVSGSSTAKSPHGKLNRPHVDHKAQANKLCEERRSCGGKCAGGAPPAYLDYGDASNYPGAARRHARGDPVMERLKNVDVVEEMTYMVPGPANCCGGEDEEDDCDYYAVCESCGEMEPISDEVKQQLGCCKKKAGKGDNATPVTYSRRQRFNFKNKWEVDDDCDDDGPPYGNTGDCCRCLCCMAGLRRNPECQCNCCHTGGRARRCNSFDETPVGKNPVIRPIRCPEEECKLKRELRNEIVPEDSGMYQFDVCEQTFERQIPRTPTPIILEVPVPRRLCKDTMGEVAKQVAAMQKRRKEECPQTPVEAEPMYLPPVYGQCTDPSCYLRQGGIGQPQQPTQPVQKVRTHKEVSSYDYTTTTKSTPTTAKPYTSGTGSGYGSESYPNPSSKLQMGAGSTSVANTQNNNSDNTATIPVKKDSDEYDDDADLEQLLDQLQQLQHTHKH